MKHILFFEENLSPTNGGVERITSVITTGLINKGYDVYVAYINGIHNPTSLYLPPEKTIRVTGNPDTDKENMCEFISTHNIEVIINQLGTSLKWVKFWKSVKDNTKTELYSFIHISPNASNEVLGIRDLRFPRATIRSILKEVYIRVYKFDLKRDRRIFAMSDKIILLSEYSEQQYCNRLQLTYPNKSVTSIPNLLSFNNPSTPPLASKKNIFLVVARMGEASKRLSRVLDCWKIVSKELPDWQLKIVGDGPDLSTYKKIAQKNKLNNISFEGAQSPEKYYKEASIFLMTSASEGFGLTITEAQQFGTVPIVMDTYCAAKSIITDRENGLLCPSDDITTFSQLMIELAQRTDYRHSIAQKAIESTARFSLENILPKWERLIM